MTDKRWRLHAFLQGFKDGAAVRECVLQPEDSHYQDYLEGWKMGSEQFRRAADWYRSILGMPDALDVVLAESGPNVGNLPTQDWTADRPTATFRRCTCGTLLRDLAIGHKPGCPMEEK